ncbi:MAG: thioredoxin domain-containing protein [Dehalococcoidia bacterium]
MTQPFTLIAIAFGVVLAIVLGVVLVLTQGGESDDAVTALDQAAADLPADLTDGLKLGRDDAPLKLTQYEDYQCPFCLRYTANQEPFIVEEYVKTGKVQITFGHFAALGRESTWAANAASCAADQNMFWQYSNALFGEQAREGQLDDERLNVGRFDLEDLKAFGSQIGLPDQATFEACVDDLEHEQEVVDSQSRARSLGITGTPGFLINGAPFPQAGALGSVDEWRSFLDSALEQLAEPTAAPEGETPTSEAPAETTTPEPAATATTPEPAATATP